MKKVLSVVLAALMMMSLASMAFAFDVDSSWGNDNPRYDVDEVDYTQWAPGDTIEIPVSLADAVEADDVLVRANWDKGASLVSVTPYLKGNDTDGYYVEIKVKSSYSTSISDLVGVITLKDKTTGTLVDADVATIDTNDEINIDVKIGYGCLQADEIMAYTNDLPVVDFTDYSGDITIYWGNVAYPDAILDGKVRTEKPALKYMGYNMDDNDAIIDANPNAGDMTFIAFDATPDFDYAFDLSLSSTIEKGYLYEIGADNKLTKLDYTWETIEGNDFYTITGIKSLGAYVISEKELTGAAASTGSDKTNPETGANDMINVAVTMAVVSLAAAAAVAFKKR